MKIPFYRRPELREQLPAKMQSVEEMMKLDKEKLTAKVDTVEVRILSLNSPILVAMKGLSFSLFPFSTIHVLVLDFTLAQ